MAGRLGVDDEARRVRDNAILLLMPSMNPDGLDIVRDWYTKNLGTPFETTTRRSSITTTSATTTIATGRCSRRSRPRPWRGSSIKSGFPQIVYNHHQSGPFPSRIWGPPMKDPVNPNLDPLVVSTINQIGEAMRKRFDEEEKPGYSSHMLYDIWWNGSMRGGPDFHNMAGFLTETALYRYGHPALLHGRRRFPKRSASGTRTCPRRFQASTTRTPGSAAAGRSVSRWSTCSPPRAPSLDLAARLKEDFLYNIWRMGTRQIARGEKARGWAVRVRDRPGAQHDPTRTVEFLRTFRIANIEIRQADAPFSAAGQAYPAGTYVIGPQSFRPYVVDLIEAKKFPERRLYPGGPPDPPYDMTGTN